MICKNFISEMNLQSIKDYHSKNRKVWGCDCGNSFTLSGVEFHERQELEIWELTKNFKSEYHEF